jgi:hypothetical protein
MNRRKISFGAFGLILLCFLAAGLPPAQTPPGKTATSIAGDAPAVEPPVEDIAKFISGIPCSVEPWKTLQNSAEWTAFAAGLEKSWGELEEKRLEPMRTWARAELAEANAATKILFYPFGGPDFMTAYVFFPEAETYVLLGLEFVGQLPEFKASESSRAANYLSNLQAAFSDFLQKSYFITHNMDVTLAGDKVDGILPILCFFLKRTGNTIVAVRRCAFLEGMGLVEYDYGLRRRSRRPYGIKIAFSSGGSNKLRTLYYFSCDLADLSFGTNSAFYAYLNGLPFETTFLKSASYLPHYKEFSNIRSMILDKSRFILEDDTGIPFRYFPEKAWDVQLYGEYIKPVTDFAGVEQLDLKAAYADPGRVKTLPFHVGYHWGTNKDSILSIRKK